MRPCALGGEIGEAGSERLVADSVWRIVGEKMNAGDDGVASGDKLLPFGELQHCRIVEQSERGRVGGKRCEIAGDDVEFAETHDWKE